MASLTEREKKALLTLLKEFDKYYNAHSMSKVLGISHAGTQKLLKRLLNENLLVSKTIGKSIVYKLKLEDDYVSKLLIFLLADEATRFERWKDEFEGLSKEGRIVMIYGSAIKDYKTAHDIDIMLVIKKGESEEVHKALEEKKQILPKRIHAIKLTKQDLLDNIKKKNKTTLDIIKNAIILSGQETYVELIKNFTIF
jgi:hypothetical protein